MNIDRIEPGETLGPFSIEIPPSAIRRAYWLQRTSRWDRFCWRMGWRRRELALRMVDVMEATRAQSLISATTGGPDEHRD